MTTQIIPHVFDTHTVRAVLIDGTPWFVARDIFDALGYANGRDAIAELDDDERNTVAISAGIPGNPNKTVVNESGLYALVMRSRRPEAKVFRKWITGVVLPAIHRTGSFGISDQHQAALDALRRAHQDADQKVEHQTRHDFYRINCDRAAARRRATTEDIAKRVGLDADAVALANSRGIDVMMAEVYGDPVALARIERNKAEVLQRIAMRPKAQRVAWTGPKRAGRR